MKVLREKKRTYLSLGQGVEDSLLDSTSLAMETHVLKHHDTRKQQSSGISQPLASDIRRRTVNGLEDRALVTNVAGGRKTKTTDQPSAHIRQDITVQVRHDEDLIGVRGRVGGDLQAAVVEEFLVEFDVRVLLGDLSGGAQEETIGHLHDSGLVHDADLLLADALGVLEGEAEDTLGGFAGDELDALDNTVDDDVLDAGVLALSVLSDEDGVDVVVRGLVAGN